MAQEEKFKKDFSDEKKEKPSEPKDTSIFKGRKYLTHFQLKEEFKKAPSSIPGSGRKINKNEKEEIRKELFGHEGGRYGYYIDKNDYKAAIKELEKKRFMAKSYSEKAEINRKIQYLKKIGGL